MVVGRSLGIGPGLVVVAVVAGVSDDLFGVMDGGRSRRRHLSLRAVLAWPSATRVLTREKRGVGHGRSIELFGPGPTPIFGDMQHSPGLRA